MHADLPSPSRVVASYVGARALTPHARAALEGLGYSIVPASTRGRFDDNSWPADLRLVDERHLDRIPGPDDDPRTPIVLLVGETPRNTHDPRVVASVARPAGLTEMYCAFQKALERYPRRAPRVGTQLAARCLRSDRRSLGAVLTLSEFGCLFRCSEPLEQGAQLNLQFALPRAGVITTRATCVNRDGLDAGLAFAEHTAQARAFISGFVCQRLAAHVDC